MIKIWPYIYIHNISHIHVFLLELLTKVLAIHFLKHSWKVHYKGALPWEKSYFQECLSNKSCGTEFSVPYCELLQVTSGLIEVTLCYQLREFTSSAECASSIKSGGNNQVSGTWPSPNTTSKTLLKRTAFQWVSRILEKRSFLCFFLNLTQF